MGSIAGLYVERRWPWRSSAKHALGSHCRQSPGDKGTAPTRPRAKLRRAFVLLAGLAASLIFAAGGAQAQSIDSITPSTTTYTGVGQQIVFTYKFHTGSHAWNGASFTTLLNPQTASCPAANNVTDPNQIITCTTTYTTTLADTQTFGLEEQPKITLLGGGTVQMTYSGVIILNYVPPPPTTVTVSSNVSNPAALNQNVTFTATLSGGSNYGGTITFTDNGTQIGTAQSASSGHASVSTSWATGGGHNISASYSGDGTNGAGSGYYYQTVGSPSTTTLSVHPAGGNSYTITVNVTGGSGTPTGTVEVYDDNYDFDDILTLVNGTASETVSGITDNTQTFYADYSGGGVYAPSSATALVSTQAATTTSVTSSLNPATYPQSETFTATVSSTSTVSAGTVAFTDNGSTISGCSARTVSSGVATCTAQLGAGSHPVVATFSGSTNFSSSSSSTLTQVVNGAVTATQAVASKALTQGHSAGTFTPVTGGGGTGSLTYGISPSLPSGLSFSTSSGAISGTPAATLATSTFTVTVTDANSQSASNTFQLTVNSAVTATQAIGSKALTAMTAATPFTPVTGGGGTGTLSYGINPGLPAGLSFSTSTGQVTGTPTASSSLVTYSVTVTDVNGASASNSFTLSVDKAATATTVQSLSNPTYTNLATSFTISVTSANGTPTGTVTVQDNGGAGTNYSLSAGQATATFTFTTTGTHTISATYNGDSSFLTSSGSTNETVKILPAVTLVVSPNPSTYGDAVTYTATVTDQSSSGHVPSGTVTFKDSGNLVSSSSLLPAGPNSAQASLPLGLVNAGSHSITAEYGGDSNFAATASSAYSETVNKASPSVDVSPIGPTVVGETATFLVSVTSSTGIPTGTVDVDFGDGSPAQHVTLAGTVGNATHVYAAHSVFTVTAAYNGDSNFNGRSNTTSQTVNAADTTIAVASSAPGGSAFGQAVTFTATVAASSPGSGTPTGTVTFKDNTTSTTLGTGSLNGSGQATFATSALAVGSHTIEADYGSDGNYNSSTGTASQTVNKADTTTAIASSENPSTYGDTVTFKAKVSAALGGVPSGTVTFKDGATTLGTARLNTGAILATGGTHTCVITAAGGVDCWGRNNHGELGIGSADILTHPTPAPVAGISGVVGIAAGGNAGNGSEHSCALLADGTVQCWGQNGDGQAGDGTNSDRYSPVTVVGQGGSGTLGGVVAITAGSNHTCALLSTGGVDCWGLNANGQLGNNTTISSSQPVQVLDASGSQPLTGVVAISAGFYHTCAVLNDGTVQCWGYNYYGQLGNNTTTNSGLPVAVSGLSGAVSVAGGSAHTCALLSTGAAKCWGFNNSGNLGNNSNTGSLVPVDVSNMTSAVALTAGSNFTCAVLASGGMQCWGQNNGAGVVGDGEQQSNPQVPTDVLGLSTAVAAGAGYNHACALLSSGALNCWGFNSFGQVGDGSTTIRDAPVAVSGFGDGTTLTSAQAWLSTAGLSAGPHTIAANYGGDSNHNSSSNSLNQTVNLAPSFNSAAAATFTVGTPGSFTVTTTGYPTPVFSVSGALPTGVSFVDNHDGTATLSGTPAASTGGSYGLALTASNGVGTNATQNFTLTVNEAPAITSAANTVFTVGANGSFFVSATGHPTPTLSESGALPAGMSFVDNGTGTATLSGAPSMAGSFPLTITASNGVGSDATQSFSLTVNKAATLATIVSGGATVTGQQASFTVHVLSSGGTPTGTATVDFGDGGINAIVTLTGGAGIATHSYASAGTYTASVTYNSDGNFATSTGMGGQIVNKATTATTLGTSLTPSVYGQSVTFTATVAVNSPGTGTPTGTVNFFSDSGSIGSGTLSGGVATLSVSNLPVGNHSITATYVGDNDFSTSTTASGTAQQVNQGDSTTTVTTSAPGGSTFGQQVTFTATVAATSPATGTPSGTVTFKDNTTSTTLGTGSLDGSGKATFATTGLAVGSHTIEVDYAGDTNFTASNGTVAQSVNKVDNTTSVASGKNPSTYGDSVLFTARVSASAGGVPTGSVTFKDGANTIGTTRLNSGVVAAVGGYHSCAITVAGGVECWGLNSNGQLGDGTANNSSTPVAVPGLSGAVGLAAGKGFTCALLSDGTATCWGQNDTGQLGNNSTTESHGPVQVLDPGGGTALSGIVALTAGGYHACALLTTGTVDCWGFNFFGQLGNNTTTDSHLPVAVLDTSGSAPLTGVTAVTASNDHTCAVLNDGTVRCWGWNLHGQLGNGTNTDSAVPVAVSGLTGASALAAGPAHTCALLSNGGAKCWGSNGTGALGNSSTVDSNIPVDVSGLSDAVGLVAGAGDYTCALLASGGVKCWGTSTNGVLGQGNGQQRLAPVDVSGASGFVALATGGLGYHACAVLSSGAVQCWGLDSAGQLGNGTVDVNSSFPTPTTVIGLDDGTTLASAQAWISTAALTGGSHAIAGNYSGDANHNTSTGSVAQTVNTAATTVAVAPAGTTVTGQSASFTVNVTSGVGTPTGTATVDFGDGNSGNVTLSAGSATATHAYTASGNYTVQATYNGDTNYSTSVSSTAMQAVGAASTTTMLSSSANPSVFATSVTFTATVAVSAPGAGSPTGSITFKDGSTKLGTVTVSGGRASFSTASLSAGSHTINASYSGDSSFAASNASPLSQRVGASPTTTTATSSPNASVFGQPVTITASLASSSAGTPVGGVVFKVAGKSLGSAVLSGGSASITTSSLEVGRHNVTVTYGGTAIFASSTATIVQTVNRGPSHTTLASSSLKVIPGQPVKLTATVAATAPAAGTPSGTVTFKDGAHVIGTGQLSNGQATFTTTSLTTGTHGLSAVYATSTDFIGSQSNAVALDVDPGLDQDFRVNSYTPSAQQMSSVAHLASGGFIVVWQSYGQDGSGYGIYGQMFDANGKRKGAEMRINTTAVGDQTTPAVVGLKDGSFIVVWSSNSRTTQVPGILAQRFNANGKRLGGELQFSSYTDMEPTRDQTLPATALTDGGFVVVWVSHGQDGSGLGVYGQRFRANGQHVGSEFRINTTTRSDQTTPAIAGLSDGGFVVSWASKGQDGSGYGIYAQRYGAGGVKVGGEMRVNTTTAGNQIKPAITAFDAGGYLVTWTASRENAVYARRYGANGKPVASQFRVARSSTVQLDPSVASFADGSFLVSWVDVGTKKSNLAIWGQRFTAQDEPADVAFEVNSVAANNHTQPASTAFGAGSFIVTWTVHGAGVTGDDIWGRRFEVMSASPR
ncbi:MAG TPA: Ig-like domain repeat protein [Pseudolabrys sp.]|nr:Ig-like domain repeat protein [Pseudolabrys sp.]